MMTTEQRQSIAIEFCKRLRAALTPRQLALVRARNRRERSQNVCHSHDFCDANVYMAEAFEHVTKREPLLPCDSREDQSEMIEADCSLMNDAWTLAKPMI